MENKKVYEDGILHSAFRPVDRSKLDTEQIVRPSVSYWQGVWRRIKENRLAVACFFLLLVLVLLAIITPVVSPYQYDKTSLTEGNLSPSFAHWFGTDSVGRDLWTRVWVGARVSLCVGFIGAILPFLIGMFVGSVAGWFGGWVDMLIMRIIDIGMCIPSMIYVVLIIVYFGGGAKSIVIALAVMNWMGPARGYRGRILQFKNREFTLAAQTLGASPMRIIYRHILPNILGNIVVSLTSFVPAAIFMEASLAFIGLGIAPPMTSLGQLASDGAGMYRTQFYQFAIPSLVISLIIFSFFMLGNCLRDALDPQLRDEVSRAELKRRRKKEERGWHKMAEHLLNIKDLQVSFDTYAGEVKAVRGVNFYIDKGETLAIVGESGCGKSVTIQTIMRLNPEPPARVKSGSIVYQGEELVHKTDKEMRAYRGKEFSMIFQDAMTSLNPVSRIGRQMVEAIRTHENVTKEEAKTRAIEMLGRVGLPNPENVYRRYPHTLSGGQRQRVMIAMALCCHPPLLLADEPTTALDVTTQAQILRLMQDIQRENGCGIVLITHNLGVVARMADRVAVMYAGQIVEKGNLDDIFYYPKHPYTWGLLGSMPDMQERTDTKLASIPGSPPDLFAPPVGCAFAARCPYCMEVCVEHDPEEYKAAKGHTARCWLLDERAGNCVVPPVGRDKVMVTEEMKVYMEKGETDD